MKTVRDVMSAEVIRLSPTNKIKTAIILMKGHNIGGLPVLQDDNVVGVLGYHDILGKDNDTVVQHIMDREFATIPPDMPIAEAANLMTKLGASRLLVVDAGQLIGVVTRGDLLPELGKSFDPITNLPRADAMRDWGIDALKRGLEITVIFIDLDEFGLFNKKYGHITGDKVLKHVAQILKSTVDEEQDMLCRYAGDEFAIVTTRIGDEAKELAKLVEDSLHTMENPELPEPVLGSVGVYGGKRTKEREDVHYQATLDNLINLASKSCTLAKDRPWTAAVLNEVEAPAPAPPPQPAPEPVRAQPVENKEEPSAEEHGRLRIQNLNLAWGGSSATAEVEIAKGETACKHARTGFASGNNALRLVADAAAEAISEFLSAPDCSVVVENLHVIGGTAGEDIVLVTALLITPQGQVRVSGSSMVKQDAYRAAAAAVLNAVNRRIATLM